MVIKKKKKIQSKKPILKKKVIESDNKLCSICDVPMICETKAALQLVDNTVSSVFCDNEDCNRQFILLDNVKIWCCPKELLHFNLCYPDCERKDSNIRCSQRLKQREKNDNNNNK